MIRTPCFLVFIQCSLIHLLRLGQLALISIEKAQVVDGVKCRCATSFYCIPFRRILRFIGRMEKLKELEVKLIISSQCHKLALVDLGGVEKTQVALKLAYTVKERWSEYSVFWMPALSAESFKQAYRDIATRCSIPLDPKEEEPKGWYNDISVAIRLANGSLLLIIQTTKRLCLRHQTD